MSCLSSGHQDLQRRCSAREYNWGARGRNGMLLHASLSCPLGHSGLTSPWWLVQQRSWTDLDDEMILPEHPRSEAESRPLLDGELDVVDLLKTKR